MNKKLLTFLCLGLAISLAGCGKNSSTDTGSNDTTPSDTTPTTDTNTGTDTNTDTDTNTVTEDRSDIEALYEAFDVNNGKVTVSGFSTMYCFDDRACFTDYGEGETSGIIVNGEQGSYYFSLNGDEFVYGNIIDRSTDGSAIYNNVYTMWDLADYGDEVWEQVEPGKYTTTDLDVLDVMTYLDGWGDAFGDCITNPLLTIENGEATFTGYLDLSDYVGSDMYNENMLITFSDLGNVSYEVIENQIANPVEQIGLSEGYDVELESLISFTIASEFPDLGFSKTSYWDVEEDYSAVYLYDLAPTQDTLSDAMEAILASDQGFDIDFDNSLLVAGFDDEGEIISWTGTGDLYYGDIVLVRNDYNTDGFLEFVNTIELEYVSPEYLVDMNGEYALEAYPDGMFMVTLSFVAYYSYYDVLGDTYSLFFPDDFILDDFGFTVDPYEFEIINADDLGYAIYGLQYFRIYNGRFDSYEIAIEQFGYAETYLTSLGFVFDEGYTVNDLANGDTDFADGILTFTDLSQLEIQFSVEEDGAIGIVVAY